MRSRAPTHVVGVRIEDGLLTRIDEAVRTNRAYKDRSAFLGAALREKLVKDFKDSELQAVAIRKLAKEGFRPKGTLTYFAVADEEAGSELGARFLVEHHSELVRAGWVLNEAGGFTLYLGGRRYYPIQVAEKGYVTVKMTVSGPAGHGSIPRSDNAIAALQHLLSIAYGQPPVTRALLRIDPDWDNLRDDPRFQKLCQEPTSNQ